MTDKKRSPLGILFLTLFIDLVGFSIIFPLFPAMLEHYLAIEKEGSLLALLVERLQSLSASETDETLRHHYTAVLFGGLLGSLYSLLQFLFAPFWGRLSDRIGRRPVLLVSIAGNSLGYLLWFFSGNFALLVAARFLSGCMSGNISTASAAVADSTTREGRARGMGIIGAAFGLGFILGPAIGGIAATEDLTARFPGLVAWGVNPFSMPALAALVLSVFNFLWVLSRFEETLPPEKRSRSGGERRSVNPLALFQRFDIPGVTRSNIAYFLFTAAFSGVEFTLTFFASHRFGYQPADMMWIFIFVGIILVAVQGGLVRRVAPRFGERNVAAAGLLFLMPAFLLIGYSRSQPVMYAGLAFMALGSGLAIPCLSSLVSLYTPEHRQGAVLGVFRSLGALARAVGPVVFCALYWKFGAAWPFAAAAALTAAPFAIAALLPQPSKSGSAS